jgi:hypothetical protein
VAAVAGYLPPTRGIEPARNPVAGFDCSGWVSSILWHAGLLGHAEAIATQGFEAWGLPGIGEHVTVWVHDDPTPNEGLHHCFAHLYVAGRPHVWTAATHTGTICGWQDQWGDWITAGYTPRRPDPARFTGRQFA